MKSFSQLVAEQAKSVVEIMPWDLEARLQATSKPLLLDVREPGEFDAMHIEGAINIPRGILEAACEYNYDETEPVLVTARNKAVVVICRSGNRSVLADFTLQYSGFKKVVSLKTGMRGWNDYEQPMIDGAGNPVEIERADTFFESTLREDQIDPAKR